MNHLTNVYKHKCEQLQEQIYNLTKILNEVQGNAVPTVFYQDQMSPEDVAEFGRPPDPVSQYHWGVNNPNGRGRMPNADGVHPNQQLWEIIKDIVSRLGRFAKGEPRTTLATALSVFPAGRATLAVNAVALILQSPELYQLMGYLLGLQGGALEAFLNSLVNGSISPQDLAKWNAAWNGAFDLTEAMLVNTDGYELNAGAPLDQEARDRAGNFDGHYRGTGGGNFYRGPSAWTTGRRPKP